MENYIPAIITASVALIVGIGAQFLNSWLTYRRENKKYYMEVYENFISVYFFDVLLYVDTHTNPRISHNGELKIDIANTLDEMMSNIHYGNNILQSLHLDKKTLKHFYDPAGDFKEKNEIKTCFYFLLYAKTIFRKIGLKLMPDVKYRLEYNIRMYGYWYLDSEQNGYDKELVNMCELHMTKLAALKYFSIRSIKKLVDEWYLKEKQIAQFLDDVKCMNDITKRR